MPVSPYARKIQTSAHLKLSFIEPPQFSYFSTILFSVLSYVITVKKHSLAQLCLIIALKLPWKSIYCTNLWSSLKVQCGVLFCTRAIFSRCHLKKRSGLKSPADLTPRTPRCCAAMIHALICTAVYWPPTDVYYWFMVLLHCMVCVCALLIYFLMYFINHCKTPLGKVFYKYYY